jgi:hypothetical protein
LKPEQVNVTSTVQRQRQDFLFVDHFSQLCVGRLNLRCRKIVHFDSLLDVSQLQRDVHAVLLVDTEHDTGGHKFLKAGQSGLDSISTDREHQYSVLARSICTCPLDQVRIQIGRRDLDTRQNR